MPHSFWIHVLSILLTSFVILLPFPSAPSHPCKSSWLKKKKKKIHALQIVSNSLDNNQSILVNRSGAHCLIAKATPLSLEIMSYLSWILVALIYSFIPKSFVLLSPHAIAIVPLCVCPAKPNLLSFATTTVPSRSYHYYDLHEFIFFLLTQLNRSLHLCIRKWLDAHRVTPILPSSLLLAIK